jgi:hypothetical protein
MLKVIRTNSTESFRATLLFSTEEGRRCLSMKLQKAFSTSSCLALKAEGLKGGGGEGREKRGEGETKRGRTV